MDEKEKKPGLAVIIAMKHKKAQEGLDKEGEEEGEDKKFEEIAQDILDAVKQESASDLVTSLKAFIKVLEAEEE